MGFQFSLALFFSLQFFLAFQFSSDDNAASFSAVQSGFTTTRTWTDTATLSRQRQQGIVTALYQSTLPTLTRGNTLFIPHDGDGGQCRLHFAYYSLELIKPLCMCEQNLTWAWTEQRSQIIQKKLCEHITFCSQSYVGMWYFQGCFALKPFWSRPLFL